MLMIRFQRIGRKNDAAFRMVVLEKTAGPKAGTYVDLVGSYNPKTKEMTVKKEAIESWITKGAQVSPSLMNLLITKGVLEGKKVSTIAKSTLEKNVAKRKAEEEAAALKAQEEARAAEAAAAAAVAVAAQEETAEEVPADAPVAEVATADAGAASAD